MSARMTRLASGALHQILTQKKKKKEEKERRPVTNINFTNSGCHGHCTLHCNLQSKLEFPVGSQNGLHTSRFWRESDACPSWKVAGHQSAKHQCSCLAYLQSFLIGACYKVLGVTSHNDLPPCIWGTRLTRWLLPSHLPEKDRLCIRP